MGYAHANETKRTKFDVKSFRCMLLGYAKHKQGYKGFDLETQCSDQQNGYMMWTMTSIVECITVELEM